MTAADIGVADRMNEHQREALISLDEDVAKIVDALKQRGVLDSTVIVYVSDNGWLLGEHRLLSKTWPYEESIKVPMVWRLPWADAARSNPAQVLNIDLAPTIAELAGAEPGPVDGTSLVPMLRWDAATWDPSSGPPPGTGRSDFVIEWLGIDLSAVEGPPPYEGVHTQRYVYVEYANGWRELYDLQTDPEQLNNLAGIAAYSELQAKLTARLKELLAEQPHRAPAPQPAVPPDATPPAALP
jgi:arylsulfatase A-like enzyme